MDRWFPTILKVGAPTILWLGGDSSSPAGWGGIIGFPGGPGPGGRGFRWEERIVQSEGWPIDTREICFR